MEETPWRRHQGGGIMEEESCKRHQGDIQETPRRHKRHPGDIQETPRGPRRHPGGTQEPPRRPQEAMDILEAKCVKTIVFFSKSGGGEWFRVHGSDVTITKSAACAQKFAGVGAKMSDPRLPNTEDSPPEPLQQKTVWGMFGEYSVIHVCVDMP